MRVDLIFFSDFLIEQAVYWMFRNKEKQRMRRNWKMWCKPFHSLEDMTNHTMCHSRLNQCPIKSRTLFWAAVKPFCFRRYRSSPMCNAVRGSCRQGRYFDPCSHQFMPHKTWKSISSYFCLVVLLKTDPISPMSSCSQCTALEHQYLGEYS